MTTSWRAAGGLSISTRGRPTESSGTRQRAGGPFTNTRATPSRGAAAWSRSRIGFMKRGSTV